LSRIQDYRSVVPLDAYGAPVSVEAGVGAGAVFFPTAFLTGAALFAAFAGAVFTAVLLAAVLFVAAGFVFAARTRSQRALVAATIAALPARLSFRFFLGAASGADGAAAFLDAAHLFRCASAMAFLPAALIFRRLRFGASGVAAVALGPPSSMARSSVTCWASFSLCDSNPSIAASIMGLVNFCVVMWVLCLASSLVDSDNYFHATPS
jgi:hypothetical protein